MKWTIKLNEFDISYNPRLSIKAQVSVDFLIECTWSDNEPEEMLAELLARPPEVESTWILHVNGASNS